ncbi:MAG TPA: MFS transporter [Candidatus Tectomicrobia bacterium]
MQPPKDAIAALPDDRATSTAAIFYGWRIVGASLLSLTVGIGPVVGITFGVFLPSLAAEFGWSRGQAAQGVALALLGFTLMQPLIGRLIGRYGAKRIILVSAACFGVSLLGLAGFVSGTASFYLGALLTGCVAGGTSPLPYGTVLARWFVRRRGVAMSGALSGLGIGGMILPLLTSQMITTYGWRAGLLLLGLLVLGIILPVVGLVLRETPEEMGLWPDGQAPVKREPGAPPPALTGCTLAEARATTSFWAVALGLFLITAATQGCVVHLTPLLTDRRFSLIQAASVVSLMSLGFLPGMLTSGYLVDRFPSRGVAVGFCVVTATGFALLARASSWGGIVTAAVLLGVGTGATVQLIPALVGWGFGLRAFGEIYGMLMAAFGLGTVLGPLVVGWLFDLTGSYRLAPGGCLFVALVAAGLMTTVRPHTGRQAG